MSKSNPGNSKKLNRRQALFLGSMALTIGEFLGAAGIASTDRIVPAASADLVLFNGKSSVLTMRFPS